VRAILLRCRLPIGPIPTSGSERPAALWRVQPSPLRSLDSGVSRIQSLSLGSAAIHPEGPIESDLPSTDGRFGAGWRHLHGLVPSANKRRCSSDLQSCRNPACRPPVEFTRDPHSERAEKRIQRTKLARPKDIDRYICHCGNSGWFTDAADDSDLSEVASGSDLFDESIVAARIGSSVQHDDELASWSLTPACEDLASRQHETRGELRNQLEFGSRTAGEERHRPVGLDAATQHWITF